MAGIAQEKLQEAVFALLADDATLRGLTGNHPVNATKARVYDEPIEGAAFPYVHFGQFSERPNNHFRKKGSEIFYELHVWSEHKGAQQGQQILSRIDELLDNNGAPGSGLATLAVTGYTIELHDRDRVEGMSREGVLRHGVATFRIMLLEN